VELRSLPCGEEEEELEGSLEGCEKNIHATQRRGGNNSPKRKKLRFATYSCKGGEIEQIENWVKDIYICNIIIIIIIKPVALLIS
jgi:hypothetical protein